jgi:NSS family neurotransmitter:Na+ symporter
MLAGAIKNEVSKPYGGYGWAAIALIGVMWVVLTIVAAVVIAQRPWRTEENKKSGRATRKKG